MIFRANRENDIDAALNFAEILPNEGPEALVDRTDVPVFGARQGHRTKLIPGIGARTIYEHTL